MKKLSEILNEKLVINKDFKAVEKQLSKKDIVGKILYYFGIHKLNLSISEMNTTGNHLMNLLDLYEIDNISEKNLIFYADNSSFETIKTEKYVPEHILDNYVLLPEQYKWNIKEHIPILSVNSSSSFTIYKRELKHCLEIAYRSSRCYSLSCEIYYKATN